MKRDQIASMHWKRKTVNLLQHISLLIKCDILIVKIRSAAKHSYQRVVSVAKIEQNITKKFGPKTEIIVQEEIVWLNHSLKNGNAKIWIACSR